MADETGANAEAGTTGRLLVVIASTRPGRVGRPVGDWFVARAEADGRFAVEVADLAALDLPFFDEPNLPRLRDYTRPHTIAWSERVAAADAFVFVMPEYNHGFTAPLKNALDYLDQEWRYKPVGFVSYGGVIGGTRAVQMLKPVLVVLKLVALPEAVTIRSVQRSIDETGQFVATDDLDEAAKRMLNELVRWAAALRPLRNAAR